MSIEITVATSDIKLTDKIGTRIFWDEDAGIEGEEAITIGDAVVAKLVEKALSNGDYRTLGNRVQALQDEVIRELVTPAIVEAWEKPIRKTNTWGEPVGEPVTLREVVIEEARKVLNESKDSYGKESLARALVRDMVLGEMRKELTEIIAAERKKVVDAVRAEASGIIARAVEAGLKP